MAPLSLSSSVIAEKNKLTSASVFLLALEITIPGVGTPVRVVRNNENVTWRTYTWTAFPFDLEEISEGNRGEVPRVELWIGNVSRAIEGYLHDYDAYCKTNGYSPITVSIFVLNSLDLASTTPVVEHIFELIQPKTTATRATFSLGAENPFNRRFPKHRILKTHCRHIFKDALCQYAGGTSTCDKSISACRAMSGGSNMVHYGGFLGVGAVGIRIPV